MADQRPNGLAERLAEAIATGPEAVEQFRDWCARSMFSQRGEKHYRVLWLFYARALRELGDSRAAGAYRQCKLLEDPAAPWTRRVQAEIAAALRADTPTAREGAASPAPSPVPRPARRQPVAPAPARREPAAASPAPKPAAAPRPAASAPAPPPRPAPPAPRPAASAPGPAPSAPRPAPAPAKTPAKTPTDGAVARSAALYQEGRREEALEVIQAALARDPNNHAVIKRASDQLMGARRYEEVLPLYEKLFQREQDRLGTRIHFGGQLAIVLLKLGRVSDADVVVDKLMRLNPRAMSVQQLRRKVADLQHGVDVPEVWEEEDDPAVEDSAQLGYSPMLQADVREWAFVDDQARTRAGTMDQAEAERLFAKARQTGSASESGQGYARFLDAAKAFHSLDGAPTSMGRAAFSLYGITRAGALAVEFDSFRQRQATLSSLQEKRDAMVSYLREGIRLHPAKGKPSSWMGLVGPVRDAIRLSLTLNRLVADPRSDVPVGTAAYQPLCEAAFRDDDALLGTWLDTFFQLCSPHVRQVGWLAERLELPRLAGLAGLAEPVGPGRVREALCRFTDGPVPGTSLSSWLVAAAGQRRDAFLHAEHVLDELRGVAFDPLALQTVLDAWARTEELSLSALTVTAHRTFFEPIGKAFARLEGIERWSPEERHAAVSGLRRQIEDVEERTSSRVTYFGQRNLVDQCRGWLGRLRLAEKEAGRRLQPELTTYLDPPYFTQTDDGLRGRLTVRNDGRAAASSFTLTVRLPDQASGVLASDEPAPGPGPRSVERPELPAGERTSVEFTLHGSDITRLRGATMQVETLATSMFSDDVRRATDMTIDVSEPCDFTVAEIPWQIERTPPEGMFLGRHQLIKDLVDNHFSDPTGRTETLLIYGLTRTGKSSLADHLGDALAGRPVRGTTGPATFLPIHVNLQVAASGGSVAKAVAEFTRALSTAWAQLPPDVRRCGTLPPGVAEERDRSWSDWWEDVAACGRAGWLPILMIDEFTHYAVMADGKMIDSSFLGVLRRKAFEGELTAVLVGAYSLRNMMTTAHGDAGQLVNVVEQRIAEIDEGSTRTLIDAMGERLVFTDDAAAEIARLSGRIPYFVQLLCRQAALYARSMGRRVLGAPDIEALVRIIVDPDQDRKYSYEGQSGIGFNSFWNNMHDANDPPEYQVLTGLVCEATRHERVPHGVTLTEIRAGLGDQQRGSVDASIVRALITLVERGVLRERQGEREPSYTFVVDLFRRFWTAQRTGGELQLRIEELRGVA